MIVIVGAGMAGLAVGLALLRNGYKVKIIEEAPTLDEVGAGISLSPNAVLALEYLGLLDFIQTTADRPRHTATIHYATGEPITVSSFGDDFEEKYGAPYYQIHRADLQSGLAAAVRDRDADCLVLGQRITEIKQLDGGVIAVSSSGEEVRGDTLVGCDGLRSVVRASLFSTAQPRWTGQVAYRATLPAEPIQAHLKVAPTAVTVGPSHIFVRYFIRHGAMVNVVAIAQSDAWTEEGWSHPATIDELRQEHVGWNEDVQAIIGSVIESQLFEWALYDREPLESWTSGRIALVGDAAHPMLPFLGMGAAMAFEDAVVLGRSLEAYDDLQTALSRYEEVRRERGNAALLDSRHHGQLLQNPDPDNQGWEEKEPEENMEWVRYNYNAATVEI